MMANVGLDLEYSPLLDVYSLSNHSLYLVSKSYEVDIGGFLAIKLLGRHTDGLRYDHCWNCVVLRPQTISHLGGICFLLDIYGHDRCS